MDNRGIAISLWFWCGKWDYSACCSSNCYQPIDRTCINEHLVKEEEGILFCMHADLLADSLRWTFRAGIVSPLYCCNVSKAIPLSVHLQNAWRRCSLFCCFLRQITSRVRCVLSVVYCLLPAWCGVIKLAPHKWTVIDCGRWEWNLFATLKTQRQKRGECTFLVSTMASMWNCGQMLTMDTEKQKKTLHTLSQVSTSAISQGANKLLTHLLLGT